MSFYYTRFITFVLLLCSPLLVCAEPQLSAVDWHQKFDDCYKTACNSESDCEGFSCLWNVEKQFLGANVKRQKSDLIVSLENKEKKVISNPCKTRWEMVTKDGCGDGVMYYLYAGYFPSIHQHLIYSVEYESTSFFLIDSRDGEVTAIYGWPVFSPDKKSFISTSIYFGGPVELPNGFEIWGSSEGSFDRLVRVFDKKFNNTGFGSAKWTKPDTIELVQYCINPSTSNDETLPQPATLVQQDTGVWVLSKEYCRCKDSGDE